MLPIKVKTDIMKLDLRFRKIVHDLSIEVLDGLNLFVVNKILNPGLYFIEVLHETGYLITKKHVVK